MSLSLPKPIELYFASENAHDPLVLEGCFSADATVRDENRTVKGIDAIKQWRVETGRKYSHTVEPLSFAESDGKIIVSGKVSGNFPGSPITLNHIFELAGDRIVSLEIRP
jgi:hypothetical protein